MTETLIHEDGIYFEMPDTEYHRDPALGSTDIKALLYGPQSYYAGCKLNPFWEPEDEERQHLIVGRAMHKLVLEGPEAFSAKFQPKPDADDPIWLKHVADLRRWLLERDITPAKGAKKEDLIAQCLEHDAEAPIYDEHIRRLTDAGITLLRPVDHERIVQAALSLSANMYLANAIKHGMPEVSIFWTETVGDVKVRRKARIDWLRRRASIDMKSVGANGIGRNFPDACRRAIVKYRYDIQAASYNAGRDAMPRLVKEGRVFGTCDREWLVQVASERGYAFIFVFWSSGPAPMTWATQFSNGNPIMQAANAEVMRAVETWARYASEIGFDRPWVEQEAIQECQIDDLPGWAFR